MVYSVSKLYGRYKENKVLQYQSIKSSYLTIAPLRLKDSYVTPILPSPIQGEGFQLFQKFTQQQHSQCGLVHK